MIYCHYISHTWDTVTYAYGATIDDITGVAVFHFWKEEGIEIGIRKGIKQGVEEGKFLTLAELVKDGTLSVDVAAAKAKMTVDEFKKAMKSTF